MGVLSTADFAEAVEEWVQAKSGRDIDSLARREAKALGASLVWSEGTLHLEARSGEKVRLDATYPAFDGCAMRVATADTELFSFEASGLGAPGVWERLEVRAAADTDALGSVRSRVAPNLDLEDFLDLLIALPWIERTDLFSDVRIALLEDLLVDQCDKEEEEEETPRRKAKKDDDGGRDT